MTTGLSRGEVETLCLLHAIGTLGCRKTELPARLGLSRALADTLIAAARQLTEWIAVDETSMRLTDAGRRYLADRLKGLGVDAETKP